MPFVCTVCTKSFTARKSLLRHQRTACKGSTAASTPVEVPVTATAVRSCSECGKSFSSTSNLRNHQRTVHNPPAFQCDTCGAVFTRKHNMETHMKICTGPSFPCVRCLRCVWKAVCAKIRHSEKYGEFTVTEKHDRL